MLLLTEQVFIAAQADVYVYAAASALGAGTVLRSIFGAIFPVRPAHTTFSAHPTRLLRERIYSSSPHRCSGP